MIAAPQTACPAIADRARGCLLGLAVGDALGATLEGAARDTLPHHTEMLGGGPFGLEPGQWTDDTSLALALADSLLACDGLDPRDLMERFCAWREQGAYSCTGAYFSAGPTTWAALDRYRASAEPLAGDTRPETASNGSIMRLAPIPIFYLDGDAETPARLQSQVTHAAPVAMECCTHLARVLQKAIRDGERPAPSAQRSRDEIRSTGRAADTLEAALWAVGETQSFEAALILAVNLGDDADTAGAVAGQIAGALYGASTIPARWLAPLAWRDRIEAMADQLLARGAASR